MKKSPAALLTLFVSFALAVSTVNLASATEFPDNDLNSIVSEVVPVDVATPGTELPLRDSGDASIAIGQATTVEIPDAGGSELVVTQNNVIDAPALTIGLPDEAAISAPA